MTALRLTTLERWARLPPMKKKISAKKPSAKKPAAKKAVKTPAKKSSARPAAKPAAAAASRPQVYSPKPIEGLGWQPFRYPHQ